MEHSQDRSSRGNSQSIFKRFSPLKGNSNLQSPKKRALQENNGNYQIEQEKNVLEPIMSESPPHVQQQTKNLQQSPSRKGRFQGKKEQIENPNKVGILEEENQQLKSQIEILRAALLDLCNEKNMQPFSVLTNQAVDQQPKSPGKGTEKQCTPQRKSPSPKKKENQEKQSPSPKKGNFTTTDSKRNKSGQMRRRRSQRGNGGKNSNSTTPRRLEIQPQQSATGNVNKKIVQQSIAATTNQVLMQTPSCFEYPMVSPTPIQQSKLNDVRMSYEILHQEEPCIYSDPPNIIEQKRDLSSRGHSRQTSMTNKNDQGLKFPHLHHGGILSAASPTTHVMNLVKSPSHSKYYEHQITNLKSELELFEQEEKKIISLLLSNQQQSASGTGFHSRSIEDKVTLLQSAISNKPHQTALNSAQRKEENIVAAQMLSRPQTEMTRPFNLGGLISALSVNQTHENTTVMFDEKSATELADQDMRVFEEIRMEEQNSCEVQQRPAYNQKSKESSPQHQQMLMNLQEVFNFIKQNSGLDEGVIRPIKITSPVIPASDFMRRISRRTSVEDQILNEAQNQASQRSIKNTQEEGKAKQVTTHQCFTQRQNSCVDNVHLDLYKMNSSDYNDDYRQQVLMAVTKQPLQQSNLKSSHSWLGATHFEQLPKLEIAASVPTKLDHFNQNQDFEPTPKVMPYEMEESSIKEQLRMRSNEKQFIQQPFLNNTLSKNSEKINQSPTVRFDIAQVNREDEEFEERPSRAMLAAQETLMSSEKKINKKVDRSESIRRAEEMLTQFLKDQSQGVQKRPEFLRNRRQNQQSNGMGHFVELLAGQSTTNAERFSFSPLIHNKEVSPVRECDESIAFDPVTIEDNDKIYRMQEAINNISFQKDEQPSQNIIHHKPQDSDWFSPNPLPLQAPIMQAEKPKAPLINSPDVNTCYYGELINLEINTNKREQQKEIEPIENPENFQVVMQMQNFKSFDDKYYRGLCVSSNPSIQDDQVVPQKKEISKERQVKSNASNYLEPQILKAPFQKDHLNKSATSQGRLNTTHQQNFNSNVNSFDQRNMFFMANGSPNGQISNSSAQKKKLSVGHKLKKSQNESSEKLTQGLSSSRTRKQQIAIEKEQQEQIRQFIQIAGEQPINMRKVATTNMSSSQLSNSSQKKHSQTRLSAKFDSSTKLKQNQSSLSRPQTTISSDANSSLISNALFLAKQLQCLQNQPYFDQQIVVKRVGEQEKTSFISKRPRTAECSNHQTNAQRESNGPQTLYAQSEISSFRQSTIGGIDHHVSQKAIQELTPMIHEKRRSSGGRQKRELNHSGGRSQKTIQTQAVSSISGLQSNRESQQLATSTPYVPKIRPLRLQQQIVDTSICSNSSQGKIKSFLNSKIDQKSVASTKTAQSRLNASAKNQKQANLDTKNTKHASTFDQVQVTVKTPKINHSCKLSANSAQSNKRKSTGINPFLSGVQRPSTAITNFINQHQGKVPENEILGYPQSNADLDLTYNERKYQSRIAKKPNITQCQATQPKILTKTNDKQVRPGQQQVKEYYQLKREHDRLRQIMQQTAQDLSQSAKLFNHTGASAYSNKHIKTTPVQNRQNVEMIDVSPNAMTAFNEAGFQQTIPTYQRKTSQSELTAIGNQYNFKSPSTTVIAAKPGERCCPNCERLRGQGLSTKFCLDHSMEMTSGYSSHNKNHSPQKMLRAAYQGSTHMANNQQNQEGQGKFNHQDLGCHVIYIDEEEEE